MSFSLRSDKVFESFFLPDRKARFASFKTSNAASVER